MFLKVMGGCDSYLELADGVYNFLTWWKDAK